MDNNKEIEALRKTTILEVPATDNNEAIREVGLPDQLAMSYGTLFARTLSEHDGFVTVTLSDGQVKVIGIDTLSGEITIGHLRKG